MMAQRSRVVFDCNVYLQALISPGGPAAACVEAVVDHRVELVGSAAVFDEVRRVATRPSLASRFRITQVRLDDYLRLLQTACVLVAEAPQVFVCQRDPSDSHYVNLALASGVRLVVSRDNDLLALNDRTTPDGATLAALQPNLRVLTPVQLLDELREGG